MGLCVRINGFVNQQCGAGGGVSQLSLLVMVQPLSLSLF